MIIGVETNNNDEPIKKTPVPKKDKEKERLEQILNTGITPKISGVRIKEITSDDNKCFYIIKIPMSIYGHMVTKDRDHRFYGRVYRRQNYQALEMEEHEVAELYERRRYSQEQVQSSARERLDELKEFKIKGKALSVVVQPVMKISLNQDELSNLCDLMYDYSIPKTQANLFPTKDGFFRSDDLTTFGLTIDGSILTKCNLVDDVEERENIIVERLIDIINRTLQSAFIVYSSPSVMYYGGLVVLINIEDTLGRCLLSTALSRRHDQPKECRQENVMAEVIYNWVEREKITQILNELLKKFIGAFNYTSDYSEKFLKTWKVIRK
jgi:hypothetical protein